MIGINQCVDEYADDLRRILMDRDEKDKYDADNLLKAIKSKQEKIKAKEDLIEDLLYEKCLIEQDLSSSVKKIQDSYFGLFRYIANGDFMWRAWRYFNNKDEIENDTELTDEERNRYRNDYAFVTDRVKRAFELTDEVELTGISMYNYYDGYYFVYKYRDSEFEIYIPDFTKGNVEDLNGYRINYKESECCWDYITGGLDYHELAKTLKEWLEEKSK